MQTRLKQLTHWQLFIMVLMTYSECKTPNVPIETYCPKCFQISKFALNFGQYTQLITTDWADQSDSMAKQIRHSN